MMPCNVVIKRGIVSSGQQFRGLLQGKLLSFAVQSYRQGIRLLNAGDRRAKDRHGEYPRFGRGTVATGTSFFLSAAIFHPSFLHPNLRIGDIFQTSICHWLNDLLTL